MIYGYARVSTVGQGKDGNSLEDQHEALRSYGCQEIVHDMYSGKTMERPEFTKLVEKLQANDTLVVTKLDRFARTAVEGVQTVRRLFERGVRVHILNIGLIENTLTGNLILTVMLAFAEYERGMIVERTQTGKAIARTKPGWKDGRHAIEIDAPTFQLFREKQKRGDMTVDECCEALGIGRTTWYKRIKEAI